MHINERLETYKVKKKKTWESLKIAWKEVWSERVFWEMKGWICRERDRENWEGNRDEPLYRRSTKLDRQRCRDICWERCRELKRRQMQLSRVKVTTNAAVERWGGRIHQTRLKKLDQSTSCWEAIEDLGTFSIDPSSYQEGVETAIRNSLKAQQISQVSSRCRWSIEIA